MSTATANVVMDDKRCLNIPAWNAGSLQAEGWPKTDPILRTFLPLNLKLPVFAHIRTNRATYSRAKIIHENRDELRIVYTTINRKGGRENKTDVIDKRDVRTLRVYSN